MKTAGLSVRLTATTATVLLIVSGFLHGTASADEPDFCSGSDPIPAADLKAGVSIEDCPLEGRLVFITGSVGAYVPADGLAVKASAITSSGPSELVVKNVKGLVTAETSESDGNPVPSTPNVEPAPGGDSVDAASNPACRQNAYKFLGGSWDVPVEWRYNSGTAARAGLPASTTLASIRGANTNVTTGYNDCGLNTRQGFDASGSYQGNTSLYANINSAGKCTDKFGDDFASTVSWGPFDASRPNLLAVTCTAYGAINGSMYESDIYIGSNRNVVVDLPTICVASVDLEGLVTHEWGHAFGLDHVAEDTNGALTMSPELPFCSREVRTLGLGDIRGMVELYGYR